MREIFTLVGLLERLTETVGELVSEESVDLDEAGVGVECGRIEAMAVPVSDPPRLWGVDSHSRVLGLESAEVYVVTGALVGSGTALVPGLSGVKWIGLRLKYGVTREAADLLEEASSHIYVKSAYVGRYFDGRFHSESARDEIRGGVELALIGEWPRSGALVIDGPIFHLPRVISMGGEYGKLYRELAEARARAVSGGKAVGVVKRLGRSRYLAKCLNVDASDEAVATRYAARSGRLPAAIGPVRAYIGGLSKHMWYVVARVGRSVRVLRIEALDEDLAREAVEWIPATIDVTGVPKPVSIADAIARRLSAAAYKLAWALSPMGDTYEGLEELTRALSDLGEGT